MSPSRFASKIWWNERRPSQCIIITAVNHYFHRGIWSITEIPLSWLDYEGTVVSEANQYAHVEFFTRRGVLLLLRGGASTLSVPHAVWDSAQVLRHMTFPFVSQSCLTLSVMSKKAIKRDEAIKICARLLSAYPFNIRRLYIWWIAEINSCLSVLDL